VITEKRGGEKLQSNGGVMKSAGGLSEGTRKRVWKLTKEKRKNKAPKKSLLRGAWERTIHQKRNNSADEEGGPDLTKEKGGRGRKDTRKREGTQQKKAKRSPLTLGGHASSAELNDESKQEIPLDGATIRF